ncbi:MAG: hypothetical protein J6R92_07455, partial [Akkermansia sp.]|nr:hypothetical protein [Akkermansia sp.]
MKAGTFITMTLLALGLAAGGTYLAKPELFEDILPGSKKLVKKAGKKAGKKKGKKKAAESAAAAEEEDADWTDEAVDTTPDGRINRSIVAAT